MSATPARSPAAVLAANTTFHRLAGRLDEGQLAERMKALRHPWTAETVLAVEAGRRPVGTDELAGLAIVLGVSFGDLLDPTLEAGDQATLDLGGPEPLWGPYARLWSRSQIKARLIWSDRDFFFTPGEDSPLSDATAINAEWRRRPGKTR